MAEANVFEMTGDDVQISYSARGPFIDQPGLKPTLTYQDSDQNLTFSGDQIRTQQNEIGSLVSVSLKTSVDAGATILTLLVPSITVHDTEYTGKDCEELIIHLTSSCFFSIC